MGQYRATDYVIPGAGNLQLVYTPADGKPAVTLDVYDFTGKGVALAMYNTDDVSSSFCFLSIRVFKISVFLTVHRWVCKCLIQDGDYKEDAFGQLNHLNWLFTIL